MPSIQKMNSGMFIQWKLCINKNEQAIVNTQRHGWIWEIQSWAKKTDTEEYIFYDPTT